jgi:1,4-dihydroxy-2-naphthoate octaprenyltransferase
MTGRHYFSIGAFVTIMVSQPVIVKVFTSTDGAVLNDALADTGKLLLLYSVLFGVGWLL